jgi:hypothetical protein
MCTISFISQPDGYALAMNRDEQRLRSPGLPPQVRKHSRQLVLSPSESGGGTRIALNGAGVTFALIDWYSVPQNGPETAVSRGEVVNAVSDKDRSRLVDKRLGELPLPYIKPFRLVGIFPHRQEIIQWQWNRQELVRVRHEWKAQQWISSRFDEPMAQQVRGRMFEIALQQGSAGSVDWLRQLHSSHLPETGPFSTCMHRADAVTVSSTDIVVSGEEGIMTHVNGAPCRCFAREWFQLRVPVKRPRIKRPLQTSMATSACF